jgi:hypothetical protein
VRRAILLMGISVDIGSVCLFVSSPTFRPSLRAGSGCMAPVGTEPATYGLSGGLRTGIAGKALGSDFRSIYVTGNGRIPRVTLMHYQVPLINGPNVFMEFKSGMYVSCNPPGSGHQRPAAQTIGIRRSGMRRICNGRTGNSLRFGILPRTGSLYRTTIP